MPEFPRLFYLKTRNGLMGYDLSILIPARNELWTARTVQAIMENSSERTECIVVLDGQWPEIPIPQYPRLTIVYLPESVGQRAATNIAARISTAKYIAKTDAHCDFAPGFDEILINDMQDDWTMVPVMKNLHVFDWVCSKGHRRYQGPSGPCAECGNPTERDVLWHAKASPNSKSYCFDSEPHFQYFGEFNHRPEGQGDITETMSLQGSFFMMTREKYWELNIGDESFGSWGSQGIQVAASTWLSGGRVVCNQKTWYAHMFRTQGGDFSFPYPIQNSKIQEAKKYAKGLFFDNTWAGQIYPLSKLVERFWPVQHWKEQDYLELKKRERLVKRAGIYSIRNKENGKVYIGSAIDLSRRFSEHLRMFRRGKHDSDRLQKAWNKYGEQAFTFNIELFCPDASLVAAEQTFIDKMREEVGWDNMYNIQPTAESRIGMYHTEEALKKMSQKQTKEKNGFYGRKHSEESLSKMREAHSGQESWNKGKPWSEEVRKRISEAKIEAARRRKAGLPPLPKAPRIKKKSSYKRAYTEQTTQDVAVLKGPLGETATRPPIKTVNKGILYYTDGELDPKLTLKVQQQILKAELPVTSVSLKPITFGKSIQLDLKRGPLAMAKQILAGLEAMDCDVVYFAEHDIWYHQSHWLFNPPKKDVLYYNKNCWHLRMDDGFTVYYDAKRLSQICGYRETLIKHYKERVAILEANGYSTKIGHEPGTHNRAERIDNLTSEYFESPHPNIDIKHSTNYTQARWKPEDFRSKKSCENWKEGTTIPGYGDTKKFIEKLQR